ncbi:MAG: chromosome segregation protein SMC, partial [Candidatus Aenigmarchaeota archaeon]|nr:chromosome segregation protein SMC [Candidatus Aenigmarchaeota archaeon]
KEKARRELESVLIKTREMTVMVTERRRNVIRLREEKEKAEKFLKMNESLKKAKASLHKKRLTEEEKKQEKIVKELSEKEAEFKKLDSEVSERELALGKTAEELRKRMDQIMGRDATSENYKKLDEIRRKINDKKEKLYRNQLEMDRAGVINRVAKQVIDLKKDGVYGTVSSLIKVPGEYHTAIEVALGRHRDDIIVSDKNVGVSCIKYLKEQRIGRSRFIPLDKIKGEKKGKLPQNVIGYAIDLVDFNAKYLPAMEYVLGATIVAKNIDITKNISGRTVTMDGDLVEKSGAMIGGYYEKKQHTKTGIENLLKENHMLEKEIEQLEMESEKLEKETEDVKKNMDRIRSQINEVQARLNNIVEQKQKEGSKRDDLQKIVSELRMQKMRIETSIENICERMKEFEDVKEFYSLPEDELLEKIRKNQIEINSIGPVNLKAVEEFQTENVEFEALSKRLDLITSERDAILKTIDEIEKNRYEKFMSTLNAVSENFNKIYMDLMGGEAGIRLEEEGNIDSGLVIEANPAGKKILNLDIMSGGEKSVTSLAFLFAVQQLRPAPFYILDEVDAALDKVNTKKIADLLKKYKSQAQFIVITHNDLSIAAGDNVYGVSMDRGVSKVFTIEMPQK